MFDGLASVASPSEGRALAVSERAGVRPIGLPPLYYMASEAFPGVLVDWGV